MELDIEGLVDFVKANNGKKAIITFHSLGDTDSIASAFALAPFFRKSIISSPDTITSNASRILKKLGYDPSMITSEFPDADLVVLLDVNNFDNCGSFASKLKSASIPILIIDHHAPEAPQASNIYVFNDESYNSTASIVCELLDRFNMHVDARIAKLLAMGIISDSAGFKNADSRTFLQLGKLFGISNTNYITLLEELEHNPSTDTILSSLNAICSAHKEEGHNFIYMYGKAEMQANMAADTAISIGIDLAFFYTLREGEVSFSARLKPGLDKKFGIHLGIIFRDISYIIDGNGGGHPCAAGAYGPNKAALNAFIEKFNEIIYKKLGNRLKTVN
ncbi:MAG: DHH family phosphoesterase [Candidatus Micrarchaeia archaeon]